jgi:uncharacterized spore protein YtfJ
MSESKDHPIRTHLTSLKEINDLNKRLLEVAQPKAVYGEPITQGEYVILPAAEVFVATGVAYGFATGGGGPKKRTAKVESEEGNTDSQLKGGGGGGSGGTANGRPVAVISVGPQGVEVKPVVDVTKIGLALLTTLGSMGLMFLRLKRKS